MKPSDDSPTRAGAPAAPAPSPSPAQGLSPTAASPPPGSKGQASGNPLRGLADVTPGAESRNAPKPSLWAQIKRAFQYGSQGRGRR